MQPSAMAAKLLALCATLIAFSAGGVNGQQAEFKCADTINNAEQCALLADFYYSTNGHTSWGATTTGWSAAASGVKTNYCTFTGIACVGTSGSTTTGNVTRMCVRGSVPPAARANARVHISPADPCFPLLVRPRRAR
jgi:hypothetical protein